MSPETTPAQLHVYEDADISNWVVAASVDDAVTVMLELWGGTVADYEPFDFTALADDAPLSIWDGEDGPGSGTKVTKTCAEWIAEQGRGWLAGTDF